MSSAEQDVNSNPIDPNLASAESSPTSTLDPNSKQPSVKAPIDLAAVRKLRESRDQAPPGKGDRSRSPKPRTGGAFKKPGSATPGSAQTGDKTANEREDEELAAEDQKRYSAQRSEPTRVAVPLKRGPLEDDIRFAIDDAVNSVDLDRMLVGDSLVTAGRRLEEGQRLLGKVVKIHKDSVFVSLGGPDEGVVSILQFEKLPEPGSQIECLVRGYLADDGLYELTIPGNAISVSDWADLREGEVVEATVTGANTGGLECKVGQIPAFIPLSQVTEYRIENPADFVNQKLLCLITEANPRRGNLVLSHRAVLERDKAEKKKERLAALEVGSVAEGVVRSIKDFGAFVDLGGLDGLIHISQLSWERVQHPGEVLKEGQKVQVRIEKIDPQTGKIGLSYRSLQDHPWAKIGERFPVGTLVKGVVSRIATFGAFVKLAPGIEGLIHLSELANHKVFKVTNVVKEGDEVEVKVLSIEEEQQRMSLSLKAAKPVTSPVVEEHPKEEEPETPRELAVPKHRGPLKGGVERNGEGDKFGLKW